MRVCCFHRLWLWKWFRNRRWSDISVDAASVRRHRFKDGILPNDTPDRVLPSRIRLGSRVAGYLLVNLSQMGRTPKFDDCISNNVLPGKLVSHHYHLRKLASRYAGRDNCLSSTSAFFSASSPCSRLMCFANGPRLRAPQAGQRCDAARGSIAGQVAGFIQNPQPRQTRR